MTRNNMYVNKEKIILHLCADTGSDTRPYSMDNQYKIFRIGSEIGVENYHAPSNVHGIVANPVCTEFSTARSTGRARYPDKGFEMVRECQRIIKEAGNIKFWVIENPARGVLKDYLGEPQYEYEPWWYGSPWTKRTALWGNFNKPKRVYYNWEDVPKIPELYIRPGRPKPSLAFMHKSAYDLIEEFWTLPRPTTDAEFRSICSQKFAKAFYEANP